MITNQLVHKQLSITKYAKYLILQISFSSQILSLYNQIQQTKY